MSRALIKYECPFCHRKIATLIFPEDPQSGLIYCPNCQVYTSLVYHPYEKLLIHFLFAVRTTIPVAPLLLSRNDGALFERLLNLCEKPKITNTKNRTRLTFTYEGKPILQKRCRHETVFQVEGKEYRVENEVKIKKLI